MFAVALAVVAFVACVVTPYQALAVVGDNLTTIAFDLDWARRSGPLTGFSAGWRHATPAGGMAWLEGRRGQPPGCQGRSPRLVRAVSAAAL